MLGNKYSEVIWKLPIAGKWMEVRKSAIDELKKTGRKVEALALEERIRCYAENKLRYFLPHGYHWHDVPEALANGRVEVPASTYPKEWGNDGVAFLNDYSNDICLMIAPNQVGKPQPYETDVITPFGTRKLGDLVVGDLVIDKDGQVQEVVRIFEKGMMPVYQIEFDDGEVITEATGDHNWWYLPANRAYKGCGSKFNEWMVCTTDEIIQSQGFEATPQKRGRIPICKPVNFIGKHDFYITPYTMGALLGHGTLTGSVSISTADDQLLRRIEREMTGKIKLGATSNYTTHLVSNEKQETNQPGQFTRCNMRIELERLGLWGTDCFTKFIPAEYKITSIQNRIDLLRGLMDTGGTISKKTCRMEYSTVSPHLAKDVAWLVRSLGGKCKITTRTTFFTYQGKRKQGALSYRVIVKMPDINPFFVEHKADRFYKITRGTDRIVCNISVSGVKKCRCIQVTGQSASYLCNDFIVTHNSALGTIWTLLRTIPCDPTWEIFTEHHVTPPVWRGAKRVVIASYSPQNLMTLWEHYLEFCPQYELREYALSYSGKKRKELTLGDGKPKRVTLACGTVFMFLTFSQRQQVWEGFPSDYAQFDEQAPKEKWIGWARSTTTRGDNTQCCMTLTGHRLKERAADTGQNGWIYKELVMGTTDIAANIGTYRMSIPDTPDAIITPKKKKELYDRFVNPEIERDERMEKEGIARYWGWFEEGSGLVFDAFDPKIHVIDPLWPDDKIPKHLPKWRVIDFGSQGITCCSWFVLLPTGEGICYRCLYERGLTIAETCRKIIEMSYNKMRESHTDTDEKVGATFTYFDEIISGEEYVATILDSRSCQMSQYGRSVRDIFGQYGIHVEPACGQKDASQIPRLREWLAIDKQREHIVSGKPKAPRLYFINGRTNSGVLEILSYAVSERNDETAAQHQDDHFIDTCKYWVSANPDRWSNFAFDNEKRLDKVSATSDIRVKKKRTAITTPYTGY